MEAEADWDHLRTPETYLGYGRSSVASPTAPRSTNAAPTSPERLRSNHWALAGEWTIGRENVVLDQAGGSIACRFHARDAHLVLSPGAREPIPFRVLLDGEAPGRVTRRGRRRGRERLAPGRPPVPARARARRGPRADAGDHVPRARRRGVRVHVRVAGDGGGIRRGRRLAASRASGRLAAETRDERPIDHTERATRGGSAAATSGLRLLVGRDAELERLGELLAAVGAGGARRSSSVASRGGQVRAARAADRLGVRV